MGNLRAPPGGYRVSDASGQSLAFVYCRDDAWTAQVANALTTDEARKIAKGIARLPELLARGTRGAK